jgi:hypothetical protein
MTSYVIKPYVIDPPAGPAEMAQSVPAAATQWFAPTWKILPLAPRHCLVRNPINGASAALSSGEYAALSACDGCRTLDEYVVQAATQLSAPPEHRPAIRELLERCARQGLLIALPDLVARFGRASTSTIAPIAGVAIPTADRPQFLARLLAGASRLQRRTGVTYRWNVFDDSRSAESRRANRDAIAACPDLEVIYHDLSASDSLERRLASALPALRDEIGSLLAAAGPDERSCGRTMNHVLLEFAGTRFLSIDDDVLAEPRRPPLERPGIDIGFAPKAAFWYESLDAAFVACPEVPIDPFAEHARWLGLPMADAWRLAEREPGTLRAEGLPGVAGSYFEAEARVIFTWNHVLGDPGWSRFSGEQLAVSAETRAWLARNPDAARTAFDSQIQWRGDASLRMSPQTSLSTTTLSGFDDTVLLPPAARTGRETDTTMGELARCIHPAAWTMSLPFALPHVRESPRQWLSPTEPLAIDLKRSLIGYARLCSDSIRAREPAARLEALGAAFVDLGSAGDSTLCDLLEEQAADRAGRLAFQVNAQLDDAATPAAWKEVLRQWLASPVLSLDSASLKQQTVPPHEVRTLAREFGRALIAWPRLWMHCRERRR